MTDVHPFTLDYLDLTRYSMSMNITRRIQRGDGHYQESRAGALARMASEYVNETGGNAVPSDYLSLAQQVLEVEGGMEAREQFLRDDCMCRDATCGACVLAIVMSSVEGR